MIAFLAQADAQTLQKPDCTKSSIDSTAAAVDKMKDGRNKDTAASEMENARQFLAKGQIDDCQASLLKATVQTK